MNIIEFENLSRRFADGALGLEDINLKIAEGSLLVIAGPNGSGKTILLRHLNGLLLPTHDLEKIIAHADRLILMQNGKIVRDGIPGEIMTGIEALGVREPCALRWGLEADSWLN